MLEPPAGPIEEINDKKNKLLSSLHSGCKEILFYSAPFGQAATSMYQPKNRFNYLENIFDEQD